MQRYHKIDPNLFIDNRKKLAQHLKPNSVAVLNANDIAPVGADDVFPFRQNSDLFYLSGIDQAEDHPGPLPRCTQRLLESNAVPQRDQ